MRPIDVAHVIRNALAEVVTLLVTEPVTLPVTFSASSNARMTLTVEGKTFFIVVSKK